MPTLNEERLAIAEQVRQQLALEHSLTASQARLFVRCLQTTWQVQTIRWGQQESTTQLEDARRLLHAADIFCTLEGKDSPRAIECYRRAGEVFEWLARSKDETRTIAPIELFAAGAYQLGGLPAMATGLMRQVASSESQTNRLYAYFLQADFDAVLQACAEFWKQHPSLTQRNGSNAILESDNDDRVAWYIVVEVVRCIGLIADSLRRGDAVRLEKGQAKLAALAKVAARSTTENAWILIELLRSSANQFASSSIYSKVLLLTQQSEAYTSRLRAFARDQFARGRGILWSSQIQGINKLAERSSFALCTPTGSGKTLIATLSLIKELLIEPGEILTPLALYIVPSRALAGEVEAKLTGEIGRNRDFIITGLYGGTDWGITDYWLSAERPTVLVATIEKADALMRHLGPLLLARLKLLILDEAHQVVTEANEFAKNSLANHNSRSMRLESFISRLIAFKPDISRIALTAVAGGAAIPVANWFERRTDAAPVGSHYRSARQLICMLESRPAIASTLVIDLVNGQPLYVRGRDAPIYLPLQIEKMPNLPATVRNSLYHYNELQILWTALHLRQGGRRILISIAQSPEVTMRRYAKALQFSQWRGAATFSEPMDDVSRRLYQDSLDACSDYCGAHSYELALLRAGIATNHGQMPQRLRRLMTELIERRICPITVATATLTEGVNLPFDLIFIASLQRTRFDPTQNRRISAPMSTAEFRNLAGRAGRPGQADSMEGITIVSVPQAVSTTARENIPIQQRQLQTMQSDYLGLLERLTREENLQTAAISPLKLLIQTIAEATQKHLGIQTEQQFLDWLEFVSPLTISPIAGTGSSNEHAKFADSLDELDSMLLAAIEELDRKTATPIDRAQVERYLSDLWRSTFAYVAHANEDWLERTFIKRGGAVVEQIYPDPAIRKRIYHYGYAPSIGQRFVATAILIQQEIMNATSYGIMNDDERINVFQRLGHLVANDHGFGFNIRESISGQNLLANWQTILMWWMHYPNASSPSADELRDWQRFVAEDLEFRLGVAIGAVVAQAWSEGAENPNAVPNLTEWRETTQMPWFGFWARELLRWGTLDPFVAFSLSQGLANTREAAAARRPEFEAWLSSILQPVHPDDLIDPQYFLRWSRSLRGDTENTSETISITINSHITRQQGHRYSVLPVVDVDGVTWLDPAGYSLARTQDPEISLTAQPFQCDFELLTDINSRIERVFIPKH